MGKPVLIDKLPAGGMTCLGRFGFCWLLILTLTCSVWAADDGSRLLYGTNFEPSDGFDPDITLVGQNGWVGWGSGGNGIVSDFFPGEGQHAFIGFGAPTNNGDFLNVWRPVNYTPGSTNPPVVRFSVLMSVEDSTTSRTNRDDFRWSVYNGGGDRLFTLDFDNDSLVISYLLDDEKFVPTGQTFSNSQLCRLEIRMHFLENKWSSTLNGLILTTNLPISTKGFPLNFGDVDAVWAIRKPGSSGDNFMVFDNYRLVAEGAGHPPPRLEALGALRPGEFLVRCFGTTGVEYILEGSADLRQWQGLKTNSVPVDGYFDHLDRGGGAWRFYRMTER